jgi:hypothetical protein
MTSPELRKIIRAARRRARRETRRRMPPFLDPQIAAPMKKMTRQQKIALAAIGAGGAIGAALYYWTRMKGTTEDLLAPLDTSNIPMSFIPGDGGGGGTIETPTTPTTTPSMTGSTGGGVSPTTYPTTLPEVPTTTTTPETTTPPTTTPEPTSTTTVTPSQPSALGAGQGAIAQMTFLGQAIPMLGLGVRAVTDWLAPFYAVGWTLSRTFIARPLETAITANAPSWLKPILSTLSTIQEVGPFGAFVNWLTGGPTGTWQGSVANVLADPAGAIINAGLNFIPLAHAQPTEATYAPPPYQPSNFRPLHYTQPPSPTPSRPQWYPSQYQTPAQYAYGQQPPSYATPAYFQAAAAVVAAQAAAPPSPYQYMTRVG